MKPQEKEPTVVDYKSVPGLHEDDAFFKLVTEIAHERGLKDGAEFRYKELSKRMFVLLQAVGAPKSVGAGGLRFTQGVGRAASKKVDIDALRMELEKALMAALPMLPVVTFSEAWGAALAAATTEGKPGEPGLTIAELKEDEVATPTP